jgi:hypothetical protein
VIRAYDTVRNAASDAGFDWVDEPMAAVIPVLGYVANLAADAVLSVLLPVRSATVALTSKTRSAAGWLNCDPILFSTIPVGEPIDQIVIYRTSDSMLIFNVSFPAFTSITGKPLTLVKGLDQLGLCRL